MKDISRMKDEPDFLFKVGQLIGAAEMTAWVLVGSSDEETKRIGGKLQAQVERWFEDGSGTSMLDS